MIRLLSISYILLFLISCADFPLYNFGYQSFKEGYLRLDNQAIDEEFLKNSKYAFIKVRFGNSRSSILTLVRENDNVLEWISADGIKIYTYQSKIIKTSGLPNDIELFEFPHLLDININNNIYSYYQNFYEPVLLEQLAEVRYKNKGKKNIKNSVIGRDKLETILIEESVYFSQINWSFKNLYYLNKNNVVEKTRQQIHPFVKPITIEFVKKYD